MAVKLVRGDLLKQNDVDAVVNTVNCVGIMGKGIALQFKNKWPANYRAYRAACDSGLVQLGKMLVHDSGGLAKPNFIINFPTKDHWRGKSKLAYITEGLADLAVTIKRLGIRSIAIPPLGCGNGGLDWRQVRPLIEQVFEGLPEVEARVFEPTGAPNAKTMEVRMARPRMTSGRAAILKLLDTYKELNYGLSRIEIQKLAYFLQEAGEPLSLQFVRGEYGPYADTLRHALNRMEGHFIRGVGDGNGPSEIEPMPDALHEAEQFLAHHAHADLACRVESVARLIEGFQSAYGMELLASVHWVTMQEHAAKSATEAAIAVDNWTARKKALIKPAHVTAAWNRLKSEGWLMESNCA